MPRDPDTKIYSPPDNTHGVPDEIIESALYNAYLDDLRKDFSDPLPPEMGGTGSYSQETALTELGAISTFYLADTLIGIIGHFFMDAAPEGWLVCNGEAVSRSQYRQLYQRIGVTYGAGNLTSTFNLPDLRGEFIRALDLGRGIDTGRTLGSEQSDSNKPHTHTGTTSTDGAHTHSIPYYDFSVSSPSLASGSSASGVFPSGVDFAGNHSHTVSLTSTGTEFRPRNVALLPCILAFLPDPS